MAQSAVIRKQSGLFQRISSAPVWHGIAGRISMFLRGEEAVSPMYHSRANSNNLPVSDATLYRHMAFTFAVIALAVKLTRCDGILSRDEFLAFRELFPLEDEESVKIRRLFHLAWEDETDPAYFAHKVTMLYPDKKELRRELLAHLSAVALSDGPLTPNELKLLTVIGSALGFTRTQLGRILSTHAARASDPHRIMGIKRGASREEIRAQYYTLMRRYHPDLIASELHYPEAVAIAQKRSASIIEAYRTLM